MLRHLKISRPATTRRATILRALGTIVRKEMTGVETAAATGIADAADVVDVSDGGAEVAAIGIGIGAHTGRGVAAICLRPNMLRRRVTATIEADLTTAGRRLTAGPSPPLKS